MKRIEFMLYSVLFLAVGFAGGWVAARFGPAMADAPLGAVIDCALNHRHEPRAAPVYVEPPPWRASEPAALTPEDLLRVDSERRGLEVGHWNTQLELLAERAKERRIRVQLLEGSDAAVDDGVLLALRDELALISEAMDDVRERKAAALEELSRIDMVLGAEAVVDAARVQG